MTGLPLLGVGNPGAAAPPANFNPVTFSGSNNYLERTTGLLGVADTKELTVVMRLAMNQDGGTQMLFRMADATSGQVVRFSRQAGNNFRFQAFNSSGGQALSLFSTTGTLLASEGMTTIFAAGDAANSLLHVYKEAADMGGSTTINDEFINYTCAGGVLEHNIGASDGGASDLFADVEFLWMDNVYYDITSAAVRSAWASPASLGPDGSGPGAQPLHYYTGDASVWNAGTNLGTGGDYIMNGAVVNA